MNFLYQIKRHFIHTMNFLFKDKFKDTLSSRPTLSSMIRPCYNPLYIIYKCRKMSANIS